jgi:TRAP transporter TAXI family solute receptor
MLKLKKNLEYGEKLKIFGPAIFITFIGFLVAYQFVAPAPPRKITMGTGSAQGAYFSYGKTFREILAQDGITLELKNTSGAVENLKLLEAQTGGVEIAFVQGGLARLAKGNNLVSLGSLFFEPLWIFHRAGIKLHRLLDMKGQRVAVGPVGSGTKILTINLLELNGVNQKNTQILSYGAQKAADLLMHGDLDVAVFVANPRSQYILQLFKSKTVKLMGIERAEAYALRYKYLHLLKLPEGVIDFEANVPTRDLALIAPTGQLVARSNLHPALVALILQAAEEVHRTGSGFESIGQFPAPEYLDFKLSAEADRYYKSGPPFFQRYLPFWVANLIDRMKIMLLPLIALLFPFFKLMPPIYRWRMRSRIYRWYPRLEAIDAEIFKEKITENLDKFLDELDALEKDVSSISVPMAFSEELYDLRLHIDLLRKKLQKVKNVDKKGVN